MIYTIAINRWVVILVGIGIIFGAVGISMLQVDFLIEHFREDFIPGEVGLEEDIAIVIAAFGVFLDNRRWLVRAKYANDVPENEAALSAVCQRYGVGFILLGIFIEVIDLAFLTINSHGFGTPLVRISEVSVLFVLNIASIMMLFRLLCAVTFKRHDV